MTVAARPGGSESPDQRLGLRLESIAVAYSDQ